MEGKDKMIAARVRLVIDAAFFGTIAVGLEMKEDNNLNPPTMATDGKWLFWDRKWVDSLSKLELTGVIAHEVMHIVTMSHLRQGNRDPKVWNYSTDYAINLLLKSEGYVLPEGGLYDPKYIDWSAEKIYDYLMSNPDEQPQGGGSSVGEVLPANSGGDEGEPGSGQPLTTQEIALETGKVKAKIQGAAIQAKKAGQFSAGMERFIDNICAPKADWRDILQRFVSALAFNDWRYHQCHTRQLHTYGVINPVLGGEVVGKLAIIVDTSGSVDEDQLAQFAGEISDILENYDCRITVIYIDTEINHIEEFEQDDLPLQLKAVGGGGTRMLDGFNWIAKNLPDADAIILYSDSYLGDWGQIEQPGVPALMACTAKHVDRDVPGWMEIIDVS